jgi:hypothetical protein
MKLCKSATFGRLSKLGVALAVAAAAAPIALASSHREAPFISGQPKVDGTDLYMFRSYEAGREGFVTILANYQPFQDPQGGPNFYMFDENALYQIHIDNDGDAEDDLTFQFRFKNTSKAGTLEVAGKLVKIPLINNLLLNTSPPISGVNPAGLNVRETFTVDLVRGKRRSGVSAATKLTNIANGASEFDKPVDNIGDKVFSRGSSYAAYANQHIYDVAIPGCTTAGRVFVGQRKEPFYIAVGKAFDLFNLNPFGPETGGNNNDLEAKNVSTLALEVPVACLTNGTEPVIGAYTTASLRQGRLLDGSPPTGMNKNRRDGGAWTQVSRVGMPLVNELIIGLDDKDKFNASRPKDDPAAFADYVTNPVLPTFIERLFRLGAPRNFPRTDLLAAFLTGISGVNQPAHVVPAEMLRLNTAVPATPTAVGAQNSLGVAAGDLSGFPNGRRPADDVVDLSLRVSMGALCVLTGAADTFKVGCKPSDAPNGAAAWTDGVRKNASNYGASFPYLTTPISGSFNPPAAAGTQFPAIP